MATLKLRSPVHAPPVGRAPPPIAPQQGLERPWREYRAEDVDLSRLSPDERRFVRGVFITMIGFIVGQKLATPGLNVEFGVFFVTGFTIWAFVRGYLEVSLARLLGFVVVNVGAMLVTLIGHAADDFSLPSLMLLVFLHLPFVLRAPVRRDVYVMILKRFQLIALFIASMVFLQWAEQGLGMRMTNLEDYVPRDWLFHFYNYVQKVNFYSRWYKPNGIFMLEASHTSQLLAMGLVIEVCILKRMTIILTLLLGLVMTYAGTGTIMVLLSLPFIATYLSRRTIVGGLVSLPVALLVAWQLGFLANAIGRTAEIAQPGTSGSGRLVAPFEILARTLTNIPSTIYYGLGPGVMNPFFSSITDVLNPTAKIITEYGLPVGVLWLVWFHFCTFTARVPAVITCVVLIQYDFTGGGLLVPVQTYYCLLLTAMIVPAPARSGIVPLRPVMARGRRTGEIAAAQRIG